MQASLFFHEKYLLWQLLYNFLLLCLWYMSFWRTFWIRWWALDFRFQCPLSIIVRVSFVPSQLPRSSQALFGIASRNLKTKHFSILCVGAGQISGSAFSHFCTPSTWTFNVSEGRFIVFNFCVRSQFNMLFWLWSFSMAGNIWNIENQKTGFWCWRNVEQCHCKESSPSSLTYSSAIPNIPLSIFHCFFKSSGCSKNEQRV